ncbi:MAG TPA: TonB-dependent receptor plug domain-containing protein, partial [Chitinophagaceae bacterium]|nr:TonB-dependent receptor plug domain-containing protein [Chitinophagaceae bacterium]
MRLTTALLTLCCLHAAARGHAQQVTYSASKEPLQKVFTAIEQQTGYVFFYDIPLVRQAKPVSIELKNAPLDQALNAVLKDQPLMWTIEKKTIIISPKPMQPAPVPLPADTTPRPAGQLLSGLVMDMNGELLSGASITIKETGKSTLTDVHGGFHIQRPAGKIKIMVSYVGYTTREVTLPESQRDLLVQLAVAVDALDEEVVQAYGKTSQRLSVSNIVKVSGRDIQEQPVMNPLLALNGRVPGLLITPTSGYLSAPVRVEIRGRNTINPALVSDPLYVIDGVPLTIIDVNGSFNQSSYANGSTGFFQAGLFSNTRGQSPLFSINPADIESVSVLKDAAATAIYGSRGANGVVLITTKKAKPGRTQFNIGIQQSVSTSPRHWDML